MPKCTYCGFDGARQSDEDCPAKPTDKPKQLEFSESDWREIYYAVVDKAKRIDNGELGPDGMDDVSNDEWSGQLNRIADTIMAAGWNV